jgi:hypothetical protein
LDEGIDRYLGMSRVELLIRGAGRSSVVGLHDFHRAIREAPIRGIMEPCRTLEHAVFLHKSATPAATPFVALLDHPFADFLAYDEEARHK